MPEAEIIPSRDDLGDLQPTEDPMLDIITRYRAAEANFNACQGDDETPEYQAWQAIDDELAKSNVQATTFAGAVAALRLACDEMDNISTTEIVSPLVRGALAFFNDAAVDNGDCGEKG